MSDVYEDVLGIKRKKFSNRDYLAMGLDAEDAGQAAKWTAGARATFRYAKAKVTDLDKACSAMVSFINVKLRNNRKPQYAEGVQFLKMWKAFAKGMDKTSKDLAKRFDTLVH